MASNTTRKNHFVPCFYTRQWTSSDGKLSEFTRPYKDVVEKRVSPKGTGFRVDLYTENALPIGLRTYLEDTFLKKVDQRASDALQFLLKQGLKDMPIELRRAWTRFVMSMLQRSPDLIKSLKLKWEQQFLTFPPELEAMYQRERTPDQPSSLKEFLSETPAEQKARGVVSLLQAVMDLPRVGAHILNMQWSIMDVKPTAKFLFMTSDRPVIRTNGLAKDQGHIGLPISPSKLFVCANRGDVLDSIAAGGNDIIRFTNELVVRQAERFVYASNSSPLAFVAKHLRRNAISSAA